MAILMNGLTWNASQAFVLCSYLRDLCQRVGIERYMRSLVRLQHGPGTGFFGVSNTGSTDCAKERFRGVTDSLEQTNRCWRGIGFISESCLNVNELDFRNLHRVEHTREVIDLYRAFEETFILPGHTFSPNDVAVFIVRNQIVCLIEQAEQRPGRIFDHTLPFSKYTRKIYYNAIDVSSYCFADLVAINDVRYASLLKNLRELDFTGLTEKARNKLTGEGRHTLPPMEIAERFGDNEFELLTNHYRHKLDKRIKPGSRWYSNVDAEKYRIWLSRRAARVSAIYSEISGIESPRKINAGCDVTYTEKLRQKISENEILEKLESLRDALRQRSEFSGLAVGEPDLSVPQDPCIVVTGFQPSVVQLQIKMQLSGATVVLNFVPADRHRLPEFEAALTDIAVPFEVKSGNSRFGGRYTQTHDFKSAAGGYRRGIAQEDVDSIVRMSREAISRLTVSRS